MLRLKAIWRILFTKNPIVILYVRSESYEVGPNDMEIMHGVDIIYLNISKDESIDVIFDVAATLEENEMKEFYGEMHPN